MESQIAMAAGLRPIDDQLLPQPSSAFCLLGSARSPFRDIEGTSPARFPAAATERAVHSRPTKRGVPRGSCRANQYPQPSADGFTVRGSYRSLPHLRPVALPMREILHRPNEPIPSVLFPESGYVSLIATLEDGDAAEVGLVGREGMLGVPLALGTDRSPLEVLVQGEGHALHLDADIFVARMNEQPSLRALMLRYVMAFNMQVTMTAACNGRHQIEQRLARWLLMAHDRLENDEFPMTHEFLSMMLGVRRAGVTVAAGVLQKAGFISYDRGRVRVTDRPGLEAAACECHGTVRREFQRLLGSGVGG